MNPKPRYPNFLRVLFILIILLSLPTANAGFLSKSFMKSHATKMRVMSERRCMNYKLTYGKLEKKYQDLLSQENPDIQEIQNNRERLLAYRDSITQAENDIEFWKGIVESYKNEATTSTPSSTNVSKSSTTSNNADNIIVTEKTMRCMNCAGSGICFYCHGKGMVLHAEREICPFCFGQGRCKSCNGTKVIKIIHTLDKTTGYYTSISSDGVAINGFASGSDSSNHQSDSPSYSNSSNYEDNYRSLERHAESIYNSITREINNRGDRKSDASGWNYSSSYSGMAREYVRAQADMKRLRAEALKEGVRISPSVWETKSIRY